MKKYIIDLLLMLIFSGALTGQDSIPKIKWKFKTAGPIRAGAVMDEDKIFFGNSAGFVYSLMANKGTLNWQFKAGGAIVATPAISRSMVLINSRDGNIYALDKTSGEKRWSFSKGSLLEAEYGGWEYFAAAPVISGNIAYCATGSGYLYALDIRTGQLIWKYLIGKRIRATPLIKNGVLYQPANDGFVHIIDPANGQLLWKFATDGAGYESKNFGFDRNSMYDRPSLEQGLLVFGSRDGNVYAVETKSQIAKWKFSYGPTWAMATTVEDGTVYVGWSTNNLSSAVDLESGTEKWKFQCGAHVYTRPLVVGNSVYIGSADGKFYRINKQTGEKIWDYPVGQEIYSSPIHQDDTFYFGSDDGFFYALTEGPSPFKAVYHPDSIEDISRFLVVDPEITPFMIKNGYERLDSAGLFQFLKDRIIDKSPSVIVFALPLIPSNIIGEAPEKGMIRQYLESGGRILWMGDIPNYYTIDSSGNFSRNPEVGERLLSLTYQNVSESGNYYSQPTQEGLNRGLPTWLKTTAAIVSPSEKVLPLAFDEYNRISIWERQFHPRPGSGFISCRTWAWNVPLQRADLEIIRRLAEYGLE